MKSVKWFGIFTENGTLFEVTPGEYHAVEVAAEETKRSKIKHHVKPVRIVVDA